MYSWINGERKLEYAFEPSREAFRPQSEETMKTMSFKTPTVLLAVILLSLGTSSCSGLSNTEKGALIGAGSGAVVGGVIGGAAGSTTKGAIIGAVVGGAAGAIIGSRMNDKAEELAAKLDNATVERVGEGILITFDSGILFDLNSSSLKFEARQNLTDLANALVDEAGDYELLVAGHTDASGSEAYNQTLSERRAGAAASYIAEQGFPISQVETIGRGEMEPVGTNETEVGQEANRRVEVAIFASEEFRREAARRGGN